MGIVGSQIRKWFSDNDTLVLVSWEVNGTIVISLEDYSTDHMIQIRIPVALAKTLVVKLIAAIKDYEKYERRKNARHRKYCSETIKAIPIILSG